MSDVEAVLLDAGGVLVLPSHEPIQEALAEAGVVVDATRLDAAHYAGMRGLDEAPEHSFDWQHYVTAYLDRLGVGAALHAEAGRRLRAAFDAGGALWSRPTAGIREGLAALARSGLRLGVVSNAEGTVEERLAALAICQVGAGAGVEVEVVIDSHRVGVQKPDPAIFGFALRAMDLDPARCLYLGDSLRIDVVGATRAGIRPVLVTPDPESRPADVPRVRHVADLLSGHGDVLQNVKTRSGRPAF